MFFLPFSHRLQLPTSSWMRESTQWRSGKVGKSSAFICAFWWNQIDTSCHFERCLVSVFVLPVVHIILIIGLCRWLKLPTFWDSMSDCRVDIQRSAGLGRKNKKRCHQGTASLNRLVEFTCLPSADRLKWAISCSFSVSMLKKVPVLSTSSDTSKRSTRVWSRPCLCSGNDIYLVESGCLPHFSIALPGYVW